MTERKKAYFTAAETSPLFERHQNEFMTTWQHDKMPVPDLGIPQINYICDVVSLALVDCTPEISNIDAQVIATLIIGRLTRYMDGDDALQFTEDVQAFIRENGEG